MQSTTQKTEPLMRPRRHGRGPQELRPLLIQPGYLDFAEGSALVSWGRTRILCAASLLPQVPVFRQGSGAGWVTAEYSMLPRATHTRQQRERLQGLKGRSQEIQRLIGRSLRAVTNLSALGERTLILDCDVLGRVHGQLLLDLDYEEDSRAEVDANFVATGQGDLVEVQLSGEAGPFPAAWFPDFLTLALHGIREIAGRQKEALAPWLTLPW